MKNEDDGLRTEPARIAMISMHSSPMGELGARDTGGMSVYVGEIASRLARRGYAVDIFTRIQHPDAAQTLQVSENVRIIHLLSGPRQPLPQLSLYRHLPEFFDNLERFRNAEGIRYDLIHSHYWLSGQVGRWCRREWNVPHLFMFHTLGALKNRTSGAEKEPDVRINVERQLATGCDGIFACTEREKRDIIDLYGAVAQRIRVVPCGVDLERFRPLPKRDSRSRLGLNEAERVILYVGRFDPIKGVDRLLKAVAELRREDRIRVLLVGGGTEDEPEVGALRSLCLKLALEDCVTFVGRKAHEDLPDYYRAADVLVLPSHYESFGLVILEALACGTPVAATRVGAVEDVVRDGVNGWMVHENSPRSLAEGIRRTLEMNANGGTSGNSVRHMVLGYDWSLVAASIDSQYRLMLGGDNAEGESLVAAWPSPLGETSLENARLRCGKSEYSN